MRRDPTQFRERFQRWKNGELVYDAGLPKYEMGKDDEIDKLLYSLEQKGDVTAQVGDRKAAVERQQGRQRRVAEVAAERQKTKEVVTTVAPRSAEDIIKKKPLLVKTAVNTVAGVLSPVDPIGELMVGNAITGKPILLATHLIANSLPTNAIKGVLTNNRFHNKDLYDYIRPHTSKVVFGEVPHEQAFKQAYRDLYKNGILNYEKTIDDISSLGYFDMTPKEVMLEIARDASLLKSGNNLSLITNGATSTDSHPLMLAMMRKYAKAGKANIIPVKVNGKQLWLTLNEFGYINISNTKRQYLLMNKELGIPLQKPKIIGIQSHLTKSGSNAVDSFRELVDSKPFGLLHLKYLSLGVAGIRFRPNYAVPSVIANIK